MGLIEEVSAGPLALDSAIFIYFIEENPRYLPVLLPLFEAIDRGALVAATSTLTVLETLVVPYRAGNHVLAERYEALLTGSRGLDLVAIELGTLRAAAVLRATSRVKTPDALQLAAAVTAGCTTFLTNDRRLPKIGGLRILQLDDYVAS